MNLQRKYYGIHLIVMTAAVAGFCFISMAGSEMITNETIRNILKKSRPHHELHDVMEEQKKRLHALMDAFLMGDTGDIRKWSAEISQSISSIAKNLPQSIEDPTTAWQAMSEIVKEANLLSEEADKNEYQKAYVHFAVLTMHCIHCHQGGRADGKLPKFEFPPAQTPPKKEEPLLKVQK